MGDSSVEDSVVGPVVVPKVGSVGPCEKHPIWELLHCGHAAVFCDGQSKKSQQLAPSNV